MLKKPIPNMIIGLVLLHFLSSLCKYGMDPQFLGIGGKFPPLGHLVCNCLVLPRSIHKVGKPSKVILMPAFLHPHPFPNPLNHRNHISLISWKNSRKMADLGPVFVAVVLFVLLTPGLLFQIPGKSKIVEFGNSHTSIASILVHTTIYFTLICIFLLVIGIHMSTDS